MLIGPAPNVTYVCAVIEVPRTLWRLSIGGKLTQSLTLELLNAIRLKKRSAMPLAHSRHAREGGNPVPASAG